MTYIYIWGRGCTYILRRICIMHHRQNTCINPQAGNPRLLGRGGDRLVSTVNENRLGKKPSVPERSLYERKNSP